MVVASTDREVGDGDETGEALGREGVDWCGGDRERQCPYRNYGVVGRRRSLARVFPVHNTCFGQLSCGNSSKSRISQQPHTYHNRHTRARTYQTHRRAHLHSHIATDTHTHRHTFFCLRCHESCETTCISSLSLTFYLPLSFSSLPCLRACDCRLIGRQRQTRP